MKFVILSLSLLALLSGCSPNPAEICRSNVTDDQLYFELLSKAQSMSKHYASLENENASFQARCSGRLCPRFEPYSQVDAGDLSQYISIEQLGVTGYSSAGDYTCKAAMIIRLPNKDWVPHSMHWSLTPSGSAPIVGSFHHNPDARFWSWVSDHTRGETELLRASKSVANWIKFGWTTADPRTFNVSRFQTKLTQISELTGVDYFSRLVTASQP